MGPVVARVACDFGVLGKLWAMKFAEPRDVQIEVANFGASDRCVKRPKTAQRCPSCAPGGEGVIAKYCGPQAHINCALK